MLLTELQAKKKTCPYISAPDATHTPPLYRHQNCQGSGCAGWRWTDKVRPGEAPEAERRLGYCGPAGRPEAS